MKIFTKFLISFLSLLYCDAYSQAQEKKMYLELGPLYNNSCFEWSIAGNLEGKSPNILSELKFNNITSLGTYIKGEYHLRKALVITADFNKSQTINGEGIDTDYEDDNRKNPTFEKKFISNKGNFTSLKAGFGFPIRLSTRIMMTPIIQYYLTNQYFYILNNEMPDLKSTYQTEMRGAEISIKTKVFLNKALYTTLTFSHHLVNYKAEADWNLIDSFKHPLSFSQTSNGSGYNIDFTFGVKLNKTFYATAAGDFNLTNISKGIDTSYLITEKEISTQFNGAKNKMYALKIGISASL